MTKIPCIKIQKTNEKSTILNKKIKSKKFRIDRSDAFFSFSEVCLFVCLDFFLLEFVLYYARYFFFSFWVTKRRHFNQMVDQLSK